ncbi:DUF2637 domain-containing protein [Mycobacteroides abscessus]|uniref:DUF2637 domain-containing protein n=1 Tax=Mycobacteroides abscessus TaxID=36809 RepID=UPI000929AFA0|nr:DUF2637 domain-containing protein [Mycobacteroides abscessus]MBN7371107.1 DUF2637 domain-containing protein [Mycobacteroides abscessus subsp. abscessus]MBN7522616.1 DUF2637 domain-containing protein [Mycobacteroides abscessus subsp. abscessus]MDB2185157.1 DUF2637 domain-containing protein [Mycobacteroides abscessus subsp. abscessus]MDO3123490.1 DUF2637 domain-containing protein [Mycobacteroides abscessus subsp. abscessus]MDO3173301.1 DUF2637 domain-containing protein [Mycobacteroides absces
MSDTTAGTSTAYRYARALLGISVALSLACNAAHAYLNSGAAPLWLTMGVGAIPPLILALSVEAVVFCSRHARWAWGWAAVLFAAGAGLVTGFSMSFAAIRELGLMAGMTPLTAPMLPVGIDALVITGLGMVALFRPRATGDLTHGAVDTVHQPDAHVFTAGTATVHPAFPVSMSTAPAVQQGDAQLSKGDAQVLTPPEPAQEHAAGAAHRPAQQAVTSGDAQDTTAQSDEFPVQRAEVNTAESGRVLALVHKGGAQPATGAQVSDEQPMRTAQQPDEQGAQLDPAVEATRLIERGSSRLDEDKLTDVIGRIARGESHNSIATTTGISRNTVMRLAGMVPTEPDESDDEASA